jgi:general nucleoside transport system permease protein
MQDSGISASLLSTLPYILTVVALVGLVGRTVAPAADGIPYEPGEE